MSRNPGDDEDPTILRAQDGNFFVAWSAKRSGSVDIEVSRSRDGLRWDAPQRITDTADEDYYPSLTQTRDGAFHLTWFRIDRQGGFPDVWYAGSLEGSRWSAPYRVTRHPETDWAPTIYEDGDGVLWIVWSSSRTGNRELFTSHSENRGRHWSRPIQLTHSALEDDFPHVTVTRDGVRTMVWTRYRTGSPLLSYFKDRSGEIVSSTSRDGVRWSEAALVSPADPQAHYLDFLPHAFRDAAGDHAYACWVSTRPRVHTGDVLVRRIGGDTPETLRATSQVGGYSAKVVSTGNPQEFLMVWVARMNRDLDIVSTRFRLPAN